MTRIGYVGLGAMGGSLAAHLVGKFSLSVLDSNPATVQAMVAKGASPATSAASLARDCDIILLCLPKTSDVREALFSPNGLAEGLGAGKLVIDQTSGIPGETAAIADELSRRGVAMLDAPVSGGIPAAQAGKVTIIASGPDEAWEMAQPVLRAMSDKVFRCSSRVGDGQALKLVNNAIGAGYRMATLELVALGRKAGLGLAPIVTALNAGPAANFTTANMLVGLAEGRSTTNFALSLMVKDLNEALALGRATNSAMPMTAGARSLMQMGLNLLGQDAKLDDVIPLTERLADIALRGDGSTEKPLLAEIERACLTCNVIAVCECASMGRRFGLRAAELARILNAGSAWSAASELVLPSLAKGEVPRLRCTLKEAEAALASLSSRAANLGLPFLLPAQALAMVQQAICRHGSASTLGHLASEFG